MYQIDEDIEDGTELAGRPQDFFTTFALGASCTGCGARTEAASNECA